MSKLKENICLNYFKSFIGQTFSKPLTPPPTPQKKKNSEKIQKSKRTKENS